MTYSNALAWPAESTLGRSRLQGAQWTHVNTTGSTGTGDPKVSPCVFLSSVDPLCVFFSSGSGVFVQGYHGASSFSDLPITSTLLAKLRIGHGLSTCNAICACVWLLMPGKKCLGALACKSAKLGWLPSKLASMVKYNGLINCIWFCHYHNLYHLCWFATTLSKRSCSFHPICDSSNGHSSCVPAFEMVRTAWFCPTLGGKKQAVSGQEAPEGLKMEEWKIPTDSTKHFWLEGFGRWAPFLGPTGSTQLQTKAQSIGQWSATKRSSQVARGGLKRWPVSTIGWGYSKMQVLIVSMIIKATDTHTYMPESPKWPSWPCWIIIIRACNASFKGLRGDHLPRLWWRPIRISSLRPARKPIPSLVHHIGWQ